MRFIPAAFGQSANNTKAIRRMAVATYNSTSTFSAVDN